MVLDGKPMNDGSDFDIVVRRKRAAAMKWCALALCLAAFVLYGFVAG